MRLKTKMLYSKMSKIYLNSLSPSKIHRKKTTEQMGTLSVFKYSGERGEGEFCTSFKQHS